jgi:hypothetical protein
MIETVFICYGLIALFYWLGKSIAQVPIWIGIIVFFPFMPFITAYKIRKEKRSISILIIWLYSVLYLLLGFIILMELTH